MQDSGLYHVLSCTVCYVLIDMPLPDNVSSFPFQPDSSFDSPGLLSPSVPSLAASPLLPPLMQMPARMPEVLQVQNIASGCDALLTTSVTESTPSTFHCCLLQVLEHLPSDRLCGLPKQMSTPLCCKFRRHCLLDQPQSP
jgi:hypothetical protein